MPSSVRRLTALDHERLLRLLRRTCAAGPGQERWRGELVALLQAHRAAERDCVLAELIRLSQHAEIRQAARAQVEADEELDRFATDAAERPLADLTAAAGTELSPWGVRAAAVLTQHTEVWAQHLMEPLERVLPRAELRRLGGAYETRRDDELAGGGTAEPPPRRLNLSRAELYELARRAGIEGRSSMTRGQLIDELQRRNG